MWLIGRITYTNMSFLNSFYYSIGIRGFRINICCRRPKIWIYRSKPRIKFVHIATPYCVNSLSIFQQWFPNIGNYIIVFAWNIRYWAIKNFHTSKIKIHWIIPLKKTVFRMINRKNTSLIFYNFRCNYRIFIQICLKNITIFKRSWIPNIGMTIICSPFCTI